MATTIAPPWVALVRRVVAEYRTALGGDLVALALFGSVARGEARPDGDVDVYVVTRNDVPLLGNPRLDALRRRIRESAESRDLAAQGHRPEPRPIFHTVGQLARHPWVLLDIAHEGIALHDPAGTLGRELDAVRRRLAELGARRVERAGGTWYWDLKPDWRPGDIVEL